MGLMCRCADEPHIMKIVTSGAPIIITGMSNHPHRENCALKVKPVRVSLSNLRQKCWNRTSVDQRRWTNKTLRGFSFIKVPMSGRKSVSGCEDELLTCKQIIPAHESIVSGKKVSLQLLCGWICRVEVECESKLEQCHKENTKDNNKAIPITLKCI